MKKQNKLSAPLPYWIKSNVNGTKSFSNSCGPTGILSKFVPNSLLGLDINSACAIHDFMYEEGKSRKNADSLFLENMLTLINQDSKSKILKSLRKTKAYIYYLGVMLFGTFFFNKKKQ